MVQGTHASAGGCIWLLRHSQTSGFPFSSPWDSTASVMVCSFFSHNTLEINSSMKCTFIIFKSLAQSWSLGVVIGNTTKGIIFNCIPQPFLPSGSTLTRRRTKQGWSNFYNRRNSSLMFRRNSSMFNGWWKSLINHTWLNRWPCAYRLAENIVKVKFHSRQYFSNLFLKLSPGFVWLRGLRLRGENCWESPIKEWDWADNTSSRGVLIWAANVWGDDEWEDGSWES